MHIDRIVLESERYPTESHYPFNLEVLRRTKELVLESPVTFFVGENGTGKSTLLEAVARECGIPIWRGIERRRFERNPYEEWFHRYISVDWTDGPVKGSFFASQIFHDFSEMLDEWAVSDPGLLKYFGGASLMTQSHGQSLMSFFRSRFQIKGLYLLDEPETALSARRQLELLGIVREMAAQGHAQFIIASHSPILLACPGAQLFSFDAIPVIPVEYEETDHYRIYRDFLLDRGRFL